MKLDKELEKGCGNVAVQCGNNIAYCDGNILCKECLARLEGFKEALILKDIEILEKVERLKEETINRIFRKEK